ncbi:MAG: HlyC/CorC family transporter [DPANN group archaeon]|nr:HlyC/CorC family transporter [DPANN group archaeon]
MHEIIWLIAFLAFSAFFSGSEIALMSISDHRIRFLKEQKRRGADTLAALRAKKKDLLITILIGNNVVNIAAASMATEAALRLFQNNAVAITTGVMTLLILFFGEIVPKSYATGKAESIALAIAPIYKVLDVLLSPIVWIFKILMRASKVKAQNTNITEDELKMLIKIGEEEGEIAPLEKDLIQKVFRFNDIEVKEVMTPRTKMRLIDAKESIAKALLLMGRHKFSRLPVFDTRIDNIIGIIYLKELISMQPRDRQKPIAAIRRQYLHKPYFIHEGLTIDKLFKDFQRKKMQIAIIVDEHGGVAGMVTLEDVLEEIVGEIFDESDKVEYEVKRQDKDTYDILGTAIIEDVNRYLKTSIPEDVAYDTISGYFQEKLGRVTKVGDHIREGRWRLSIIRMAGNRIELIKAEKGQGQRPRRSRQPLKDG